MEDEILKEFGIKDFDELNAIEREEYYKILDVVSTSQITIEDFKRHVEAMRHALELTLVDEPEFIHSEILPFLKRPNPKIAQLKARLKNYLLFEAFFARPDQAKQMIEMYKRKAKIK